MALTFDQHKVAIDTAYPTPPIEWARQDDHVTYGHPEVATVALTFNAVAYHYLGSLYREHGEEVWKIRHVLGDRGRGGCSRWAGVLGRCEDGIRDLLGSALRRTAGSPGGIGLRQGRGGRSARRYANGAARVPAPGGSGARRPSRSTRDSLIPGSSTLPKR